MFLCVALAVQEPAQRSGLELRDQPVSDEFKSLHHHSALEFGFKNIEVLQINIPVLLEFYSQPSS